jgi:hypothetical protein
VQRRLPCRFHAAWRQFPARPEASLIRVSRTARPSPSRDPLRAQPLVSPEARAQHWPRRCAIQGIASRSSALGGPKAWGGAGRERFVPDRSRSLDRAPPPQATGRRGQRRPRGFSSGRTFGRRRPIRRWKVRRPRASGRPGKGVSIRGSAGVHRPTHSAHGDLYWRLFMWPLLLGSRFRQAGRTPPGRNGTMTPAPVSEAATRSSALAQTWLFAPEGSVWLNGEGSVTPQWDASPPQAGA